MLLIVLLFFTFDKNEKLRTFFHIKFKDIFYGRVFNYIKKLNEIPRFSNYLLFLSCRDLLKSVTL